jgi:organic hydroperoxide reductase OsmC/OhrA
MLLKGVHMSPEKILYQYSARFLDAMKYVAAREKWALPGESAQALIGKAHIVCPYSNATQGNTAVKLGLVP